MESLLYSEACSLSLMLSLSSLQDSSVHLDLSLLPSPQDNVLPTQHWLQEKQNGMSVMLLGLRSSLWIGEHFLETDS